MVSESFAKFLTEAYRELKEVDSQLKQIDGLLKQLSASDEVLKRLMKIPSYGPVVSSEFVLVLGGDGRQFKCGCVATAWLVPRHFGSGGVLEINRDRVTTAHCAGRVLGRLGYVVFSFHTYLTKINELWI